MIKFKILKYKHIREATALQSEIETGTKGDEDLLRYALSLVEDWDLVDVETNEPLPVGELDELSTDQMQLVFEEFGKAFAKDNTVPK